MAWDVSETAATQLTAITETEQFFDLTPQNNPRELVNCVVEYNPPGSPTDALIVSVYRSVNDTPAYSTTPFMQFLIANAPDPNSIDFDIMGTYQFRIGVKMDGSTDTTGVADFTLRKDGVNA